MSDLISRQAAIDALIELTIQRDKWDDKEGFAQKRGIDAAICAIEDLPSAERHGWWIPITERLPEEDYETGTGVQFSADVLATIVNHANDGELYVWLLKTVDGKWYDYTPNEDGTHNIPYWCEVIAWMPLPELYKGGAEE